MFVFAVAVMCGVVLLFQVFYDLHRRDITVLYLYNGLSINKQYSIMHKVVDGTLEIILYEEQSGKDIIVRRVYEKGVSVYFETENGTYQYRRLLKQVMIHNTGRK